MGIGKIIAIIGGVAVGAVGAYNYSTTGCALSMSCESDSAEPVLVQTVAAESDAYAQVSAGCDDSVSTCSETKVAEASCSDSGAETALMSVSEEAESACCEAEPAEAVEEVVNAECCKTAKSDG